MAELYAGNIPKDLEKMGILLDGLWDGLTGVTKNFDEIGTTVDTLLAEAGFRRKETVESKNRKVAIYDNGNSSAIVNIRESMPSGAWKSDRLLGYGQDTVITPVLDSVQKFYIEKAKFTVERK